MRILSLKCDRHHDLPLKSIVDCCVSGQSITSFVAPRCTSDFVLGCSEYSTPCLNPRELTPYLGRPKADLPDCC
jgi:hypothetical protein